MPWADTDQKNIDLHVHLRYQGDDDTFYWERLSDSGLHNLSSAAQVRNDELNNPAGTSGFTVGEYYYPALFGKRDNWENIIGESGFYSNNIHDRPTPVYIEKLMKRLDEVAMAHDWVTYDSGNVLIGESGFQWYKYYGTIEQHFVPNSGRPYALNGYPLSSVLFWERLGQALVFAYDRCLTLYGQVITTNPLTRYDVEHSGNLWISSVDGSFDRVTTFPYTSNTWNYTTERYGKSKYRQTEPNLAITGEVDSGVLTTTPTGDLRYYLGPDRLDIPHVIFDPNVSGEALFSPSLEKLADTDITGYSRTDDDMSSHDHISPVSPFSENSWQGGAGRDSDYNTLFFDQHGEAIYQHMTVSGIQHQPAMSRAQYQTVVDTWYGLCADPRLTFIKEELYPTFLAHPRPEFRRVHKVATINHVSYLWDEGRATISDQGDAVDVNELGQLYRETPWNHFTSKKRKKDGDDLEITQDSGLYTLGFGDQRGFVAETEHYYRYDQAKKVESVDTGLPVQTRQNVVTEVVCTGVVPARNHIVDVPNGDVIGERATAYMECGFSYLLIPISLRAYHQPDVEAILAYTDGQILAANERGEALPVTENASVVMNEHFRRSHATPLRSRMGYDLGVLGSGYWKGTTRDEELEWQGVPTHYDLIDDLGGTVRDPVSYIPFRRDEFTNFGPEGYFFLLKDEGSFGNVDACRQAFVDFDSRTAADDVINHWEALQDLVAENTVEDSELVYGFIDVFGDANCQYPCGTKPADIPTEIIASSIFSQTNALTSDQQNLDDTIAEKLDAGNYTVIKNYDLDVFENIPLEVVESSGLDVFGNLRTNRDISLTYPMLSGYPGEIEQLDVSGWYTAVPPSGATHMWIAIKPKTFNPTTFQGVVYESEEFEYHSRITKCRTSSDPVDISESCADLNEVQHRYDWGVGPKPADIGWFRSGLAGFETPAATGIRVNFDKNKNIVNLTSLAPQIRMTLGLDLPSGISTNDIIDTVGQEVRYLEDVADSGNNPQVLSYFGNYFGRTFPYYY